MRIYISMDIEGIPGVVSRENLSPGAFEYEPARDWMTRMALAACETAHELGAGEIVMSDSHGNGQNIRFEKLPSYVQLARSWPRPLGMMQGVDIGRFDGAFLIGYHPGAHTVGGILSHTMSGDYQELKLNGVTVSEAGFSAATAGHFGVPVLLAAGDDVFVAESRDFFGDIATATLKTSLGFSSGVHVSLDTAEQRLRTGVRDAIARIGAVKPYVVKGPVSLEIRTSRRFMAEWLSYLGQVELIDAFTIRYAAKDIIDASRFMMFLSNARKALA